MIARILKDPALTRPPKSPLDAVDEVLARLRDRLGALSCDVCVHGLGLTPCFGDTLHDHVVVARSGACINLIKNIFGRVLRLAETHYKHAGILQPCRVELETNPDTPAPAGDMVLAFGGKVVYADDNQGTAATVKISIDVMSLDQGSPDTLPYVVAHEMYCHVFQNIQGESRSKRSAVYKIYDVLAEGWMDYVAAEIVAGGPEALDHGPFNNSSVAAASRQIHKARRFRGGKKPFPKAGHVRIGYEAAFDVLTLFRIHNHGPDAKELQTPWDDFLDLSLQLNAHPWTPEQRFTALLKLHDRLCDDRDLVDAFLKWRFERDVKPLVGALLKFQVDWDKSRSGDDKVRHAR